MEVNHVWAAVLGSAWIADVFSGLGWNVSWKFGTLVLNIEWRRPGRGRTDRPVGCCDPDFTSLCGLSARWPKQSNLIRHNPSSVSCNQTNQIHTDKFCIWEFSLYALKFLFFHMLQMSRSNISSSISEVHRQIFGFYSYYVFTFHIMCEIISQRHSWGFLIRICSAAMTQKNSFKQPRTSMK